MTLDPENQRSLEIPGSNPDGSIEPGPKRLTIVAGSVLDQCRAGVSEISIGASHASAEYVESSAHDNLCLIGNRLWWWLV